MSEPTTRPELAADERAQRRRLHKDRRGFGCAAEALCPNTASNTITFHPYSKEGIVDTGTTITHQVCPKHRPLYDGLNGYTVIRLAVRCLGHRDCEKPATVAVTYRMVHGDDGYDKRINVCDEHADKYLNRPKTFIPVSTRPLKVYIPEEWRDEVQEEAAPANTDPTALTFVAPD